MRRFSIILFATLLLSAQVKPVSAYSIAAFTGIADVTFSTVSFIPSSFYLTMLFYNPDGPIQNATFNGVVGQGKSAGTSINSINVTSTLIGFGPGGADDPIFSYTLSPGASLLTLDATFATLYLTPGGIFASQTNFTSALGPAAVSFSQDGSAYNGLIELPAFGIVQFRTTPTFSFSNSSSVSSVPLPPALPMFASALVALGVSCLWKKRRSGVSADSLTKCDALDIGIIPVGPGSRPKSEPL